MAPRVPVSSQDVRWGDEKAAVTVVLFGQFPTPQTRHVLRRLLKIQTAVGPAAMRIVWKFHQLQIAIPFEDKLEQAAVAIQAIEGGEVARKFVLDMLEHSVEIHSFEQLLEAARKAGLKDTSAFEKRLVAEEFAPKLTEDTELKNRLAVEQAPTLFVNGYRVSGLAPTATLRSLVDDEISKVAELRSGGKTENIYALRTLQNASNEQTFASTPPPLTPGTYRRIELGTAPSLGSSKALVTMVMFGGYQDPFSQRAWKTIAALRKRYKNDLRVVWKDAPLPFHPAAIPLAAMAREARTTGDASFWRVHEKLIDGSFWEKHRGQLSSKETVATGAEAVRKELFLKTTTNEMILRHEPAILREQQEWSASGSKGTPSFFINGAHLSGAQSEEKFREAIDRELARTRDKVKSGTKPEDVYGALQAEIKDAEDD